MYSTIARMYYPRDFAQYISNIVPGDMLTRLNVAGDVVYFSFLASTLISALQFVLVLVSLILSCCCGDRDQLSRDKTCCRYAMWIILAVMQSPIAALYIGLWIAVLVTNSLWVPYAWVVFAVPCGIALWCCICTSCVAHTYRPEDETPQTVVTYQPLPQVTNVYTPSPPMMNVQLSSPVPPSFTVEIPQLPPSGPNNYPLQPTYNPNQPSAPYINQ